MMPPLIAEQKINGTRFGPVTSWTDGEPDAPTTTAIEFYGSVQIVDPEEVEMLDAGEGEEGGEIRKIYAHWFRPRPADEQAGTPADVLDIDGEKWKVFKSDPKHGHIEHYRAFVREIVDE